MQDLILHVIEGMPNKAGELYKELIASGCKDKALPFLKLTIERQLKEFWGD